MRGGGIEVLMVPEVCAATIDALTDSAVDALSGTPGAGLSGALPRTGGGSPAGWILAGMVLLAVGAVLLMWRFARRRVPTGVAAVLLLSVGILVAGVAAPAVPVGANAPVPVVTYREGCGLFTIDAVEMAAVDDLLPGDERVALSAQVRNEFDGPIELMVDATLADGGGLVTGVVIDGHPGAETVLAAGQEATVSVTIALPETAGDDQQGRRTDLVVSVRGAEA